MVKTKIVCLITSFNIIITYKIWKNRVVFVLTKLVVLHTSFHWNEVTYFIYKNQKETTSNDRFAVSNLQSNFSVCIFSSIIRTESSRFISVLVM